MKEYLRRTFEYNDWAIGEILKVLPSIPEMSELLKLLSHLVYAQDKWYNRIFPKVEDSTLPWSGPEYSMEELPAKWNASVGRWLDLLKQTDENELKKAVKFRRPADGKTMTLSLQDLMLQLNYHCIHHRAQMNTIISRQGIKPPQTDYIFTVLKEE